MKFCECAVDRQWKRVINKMFTQSYQFVTLHSPFSYISVNRHVQKASFALIASDFKGERCYLLQWNDKWQCYNFIGGKVDVAKGDSENFYQTMRREIVEEIGIGSSEHISIDREIKRIHLCQYSQREKRFKQYQFALFEIRLFSDLPADPTAIQHALKWLSTRHTNVYVTREEIKNLQTSEGKPISRTVRRILKAVGEIS
jgi:8-oxo-dGTP pyrophosphatase MutT (NUDIX family)